MRSLFAITLICLASACTQPHKPDSIGTVTKKGVIAERTNHKYNLTCLFLGENVKFDEGLEAANVEQVVLRDNKSGRQVIFRPPDQDHALEESHGFFTDVWSPDEEWLVLPLGRWEGFALIRASEAMKQVDSAHYSNLIYVKFSENSSGLDNSLTGLWHEFGKWDGSKGFLFTAGREGEQTKMRFGVDESIDQLPGDFVAFNGNGRLVPGPFRN